MVSKLLPPSCVQSQASCNKTLMPPLSCDKRWRKCPDATVSSAPASTRLMAFGASKGGRDHVTLVISENLEVRWHQKEVAGRSEFRVFITPKPRRNFGISALRHSGRQHASQTIAHGSPILSTDHFHPGCFQALASFCIISTHRARSHVGSGFFKTKIELDSNIPSTFCTICA